MVGLPAEREWTFLFNNKKTPFKYLLWTCYFWSIKVVKKKNKSRAPFEENHYLSIMCFKTINIERWQLTYKGKFSLLANWTCLIRTCLCSSFCSSVPANLGEKSSPTYNRKMKQNHAYGLMNPKKTDDGAVLSKRNMSHIHKPHTQLYNFQQPH